MIPDHKTRIFLFYGSFSVRPVLLIVRFSQSKVGRSVGRWLMYDQKQKQPQPPLPAGDAFGQGSEIRDPERMVLTAGASRKSVVTDRQGSHHAPVHGRDDLPELNGTPGTERF